MSHVKSSELPPRDRLGVYLDQAEGLRRTPLVQQGGLSTSFTIQIEKVFGSRIITREPNEGALRLFLTYFRPFVSENDTVFVPRVFDVCWQHLTSDKLREHLLASRKHWKKAMKTAGIGLVVDGEALVPERVMDFYIKHIFHPGDPERMALLKRLGIPGQVTSRHTFYDLLGEATGQILMLANVIKIAFRDGCLRL